MRRKGALLLGSEKFVVSRSTHTKLTYPHSELLAGDAVEAVAKLKLRYDGDVMVMSSGQLVRPRHTAGLVDRYALQIYAIALGSGTRLFGSGDRADLRLERSIPTGTGVLFTEYIVIRGL